MPLPPVDVDQLHARARTALRQGRAAEAEPMYRRLLAQTQALDEDYEAWLREAVAAYRALGRSVEAGHALVYLQRYAEAHAAFLVEGARVAAARCRDLWARRSASEAGRSGDSSTGATAKIAGGKKAADAAAAITAACARHLEAGREYADAGLPAHAAISFAAGGAPSEARRQWEKILSHPRMAGRLYEQALAHFQLGMAVRSAGESSVAQRHLARAQRLLEEVADDFETRGERERAFDCYALLLHLGREEGAFENVAEGYINCIRILKEDNLKYYVLQYYEDFLRIALEVHEDYAAATVAREAADYARRAGMPYERHYLKRAGEIWWRAADKNERDGGPLELTESALSSAVDCYGLVGDFAFVRRSYERLASLPVPERKRERYRLVAARYADAPQRSVEPTGVPDYLRQRHAYPPVWELDLVEWELDGDPLSVCAAILGDAHFPNLVRRRALLAVLAHEEGVRSGFPVEEDPRRLAQWAENLGELQAYAVLRPLEKLGAHAAPEVRRGVMRALRHLYFKRTFVLVERGLGDAAPEVRDAALESLESLHFPHAFDPLTRLFRSHPEHAIKATALGAIGRIATVEAGEFLIQVLREESPGLRELARRLLTTFDNGEIVPILRRHFESERGSVRDDLERILRGDGGGRDGARRTGI